jgi:PBSX family phage terminase large subunit
MNIAEGSVRSGKTTDNIFCFAHDLKRSKDKLHLATASTQPTAKIIIGDCDGYGLEHIFRGQCKGGKYKGNECLRICGKDTDYQEKIVLFCGGAKADSYKKFRGMSIGLWIATEINLHHAETIREAMRRQINADIKRFYWDLNPESPHAEIYQEFIDFYDNKSKSGDLKGGFNLITFNIFDNINLSQENLEAEISKYDKGSVFYKRDILGQRCAAEGLVYPLFANNEADYYISAEDVPDDIRPIYIGQDFGGNKSKHAYCASAVSRDGRTLYVLASHEDKATGTDVEYICNSLGTFINRVEGIYERRIAGIYADSAEQAIINTERGRFPSLIRNSIKNEVIDRIRTVDLLLSARRIKIVKEHNESLISALRDAMWDTKSAKDKRLDIPGVTNVCPLDAFEYSWEHSIRDLTRR